MKEYLLELFHQFVYISQNLDPTEQWVVIAAAFLLLIFLAYRTLGLGAVLGLVAVAFFAYVLYGHDSFGKYEERQKNEAAHMKQIEEELQKDALKD